MLYVSGTKDLVEFCSPCGDKVIMTNPITNEEITILALYNRSEKIEASKNDD